MKISEVKKKYPSQWVLTKVLKEGLDEPKEVRVLKHSKSRDEIYDALKKTRARYTFHFYTGKIPKEGYVVALGFLKKGNSCGAVGSFVNEF